LVFDDGKMGRVDEWDDEWDDWISSVVFGVGKDYEVCCSEGLFYDRQAKQGGNRWIGMRWRLNTVTVGQSKIHSPT
jgi:hypothetical protein